MLDSNEICHSEILRFSQSSLGKLKDKLLGDISYFANKNVIYMDYPVHNNIGDHLIYRGAIQALAANNNKILAQFCVDNYCAKKVARLLQTPNTVIVFHGGGNFGDLYSYHQMFRMKVINDFPKANMIIMPQSIFYQNERVQAEQLHVFAKPNISVHVRDKESLDLIQKSGVNGILSPDCAQALVDELYTDNYLPYRQYNDETPLVFRRKDKEARPGLGEGFDWCDLFDFRTVLISKFVRRISKIKVLSDLSAWAFGHYSNHLINKATGFYAQYSMVDTDRLHGFLLAVLMGLDVRHFDNSYLKIKRYREIWLGEGSQA